MTHKPCYGFAMIYAIAFMSLSAVAAEPTIPSYFDTIKTWKQGDANAQYALSHLCSIDTKTALFKVLNKNSSFSLKLASPVTCSTIEIVLQIRARFIKRPFLRAACSVLPQFQGRVLGPNDNMWTYLKCGSPQIVRVNLANKQTTLDGVEILFETLDPYFGPDTIEILNVNFLQKNSTDHPRQEYFLKPNPVVAAIVHTVPADAAPKPSPEVKKEETIPIAQKGGEDIIIENYAKRTVLMKIEDRLVGATFKGLGKAFIAVLNVNAVQEAGVKKMNKMSDFKYEKKYAAVYPIIKKLPKNIRDEYDIKEKTDRQWAIGNIKSLTKKRMFDLLNSIPDEFIVDTIRDQFSVELKKSTFRDQIKQIWTQMTKNLEKLKK